MNIVAERLQEAMDARHMKQVDLVAKTGIGKSSISTYLAGEYLPKQTNLYKLAKALSVNPAWLLGEDVPMEEIPPSKPLPSNLKRISEIKPQRIRLIGEVAAGEPILAEEDYEAYIDVDTPIKADYALTVRGDSMEPTYLSGDVVYIRRQDDVDDGQIAVVLIDDSATLKHVYHEKNGVLLVSENPKHPPKHKTFEECDCIRILGIVVGYTRMYGNVSKLSGVKKGMPKS